MQVVTAISWSLMLLSSLHAQLLQDLRLPVFLYTELADAS